MGIDVKYQVRWITNTALICIFASSVLLVVLQRVLSRDLGHDYSRAFYTLKSLDSSLLLAVSVPVAVYVLLVSALVIFFKLLISHKIAGPLYRLEACAAALGKGDLRFCTQLRRGDQLNGVARSFGKLKEYLCEPLHSAGEDLREIRDLFAEAEGAGAGDDQFDTGRNLALLEQKFAELAETLESRIGGEVS